MPSSFSAYYHQKKFVLSIIWKSNSSLKINRLKTWIFTIKLAFLLLGTIPLSAQMITGVWRGKINRQKVEVRIIQSGDSLRGSAHYYESANKYRKYSIRGYFDANTNEAVWWDDQLISQQPPGNGRGMMAMLSRADFNCPGSGRMMLDGKAGKVDQDPRGEVHLDKVEGGMFNDDWDFVIDNYLAGANDPYIIDSIGSLAMETVTTEPMEFLTIAEPPSEKPMAMIPPPPKEPEVKTVIPPKEEVKPIITPPTIEEKYIARKKILALEIPVSGDSIEIRFYDNAEIDGDSISLFLGDKLIFSHIRLTGSPYTIHLPVSELDEVTELTMVAENLGTIPPNTSYMVAVVNEIRYEARLESNEGASAMVRFVKSH